MALPEQIRRQSEEVQGLYRDLNPEGADPANAPARADGGTPAPGPAAPTANPAPAPQPTPGEQGEGTGSGEDWAQRYRTLQGMFNSEVPKLRRQNAELAERATNLEQLVASMSAAPAHQGQPPAPAPQQKLVTDKDVEDYGDSLDVMRRVSQEVLHPFLGRLAALESAVRQFQTSFTPKIEQLAQRSTQTAEQAFWSELNREVSNWQEINNNPDFQSWLLEIDPLTGLSRQTYLEDAQNNLDAVRVIRFFKTWAELTGASVAQHAAAPSAATSELARQVSPGKGKGGGAPTSAPPKTYTQADIRKFFDDVRKGLYKGKEEERDRTERDIFAAQRDGRIVPETR